MRKIAFIGGFDKFDLILYTAIIIKNQLGVNSLIVDATLQEKARYIVPTLENKNYNTSKYITTFQGVDIAVGFKTLQQLEELGVFNNKVVGEPEGEQKEKYAYMFIDVDDHLTLDSLNLNENDLIFLTTAFDLYSLNKAFRVTDNTTCTLPIHKILFGKKIKNIHISFLENVAKNKKINWGKYNIEFPYDNGDWTIIQENQMENRFSVTKFSNKFKSGLKTLVRLITNTSAFDVNATVNRMQKNEKR